MEGEPAYVVVVDDNPAITRVVSLTLRLGGYEVEAYNNGFEALTQLRERSPSLIILDLLMPDIDGRTFYRKARALGFAGPVLILSGYGAMPALHELGATAALMKPFDPDDLLRTVSEMLSRSSTSP